MHCTLNTLNHEGLYNVITKNNYIQIIQIKRLITREYVTISQVLNYYPRILISIKIK